MNEEDMSPQASQLPLVSAFPDPIKFYTGARRDGKNTGLEILGLIFEVQFGH